MKRTISVIMAIVMMVILVGCGSNSAESTGANKTDFKGTRLAMGTSSVSSTYYILGTGWAELMKNKLGVEVSIEATPGGITNMQSMKSGDMDLGLTTCWLAGQGMDGTNWANGTKYDTIRTMFPTHSSVMYIFTLASSGINTIQDVEGKRVACGAAGSTSGDAAPLVFDALGIKPASYTGLSSTATCDALKDGTVDVGIGVTGIPASWLLDLETAKDIKIIPLSDEDLKKILADQPYWAAGKIPGGTYKNHADDIPCIAYWNEAICNADMDADLVYTMVKTTFENLETLKQVDKNAAGIDVANLDTMVMPLHPGALRYYEEIGVKIPDKLK
ncbi:MAG: TAXI family TRAP transporter solute-binding subunit [Lachnospiraceae bacterium]|nr:TAXI family TRAP transporter solute-binding subunit [Lachnospiraceae bacterium]